MSSDWPKGVITTELDNLESSLSEITNSDFESLYKAEFQKSLDVAQLDYARLLLLERALVLAKEITIENADLASFVERRAHNPRVIGTYVRYQLLISNIETAQSIFNRYPATFFPTADRLYIESLFALRKQNEIEWLQKTKDLLAVHPTHRGGISAIATRELKLNFQIGALQYVRRYLEEEPLDVPVRMLFVALLIKHEYYELAKQEEYILFFLDPTYQSRIPEKQEAMSCAK